MTMHPPCAGAEVGMRDLSERNRELFCSVKTRVMGDADDCEDENV